MNTKVLTAITLGTLIASSCGGCDQVEPCEDANCIAVDGGQDSGSDDTSDAGNLDPNGDADAASSGADDASGSEDAGTSGDSGTVADIGAERDAGPRTDAGSDSGAPNGCPAGEEVCASGCCVLPAPAGSAVTVFDGITIPDIDIAVDSTDTIHVVYRDGGLMHATWDGAQWVTQQVLPDRTGVYASYPGTDMSLAIDSQDRPHIAQYNEGNASSSYVYWDGVEWVNEGLSFYSVANGSSGSNVSLALDANDVPHMSYRAHEKAEARYRTKVNGSWVEEVVKVSTYPSDTSIQVDSTGTPQFAYGDRKLWFAKRMGPDNWSTEVVFEIAGDLMALSPSLQLDAQDRPHISFHHKPAEDVRYAHWNGTDWEISVVDFDSAFGAAGGGYTSLELDSLERPHVAYYQFRQGTAARYAFWDGQQWNPQVVERHPGSDYTEQHHMGVLTKLTLDSQDRPHMIYLYNFILSYGSWNHELHYARP